MLLSNLIALSLTVLVGAIHSTQAGFCDSKGDGFYARKETGCRSYYRCVNRQTYGYNCPGELLFNDDVESCDHPQNVKCGHGSNPGNKRPATTRRPTITRAPVPVPPRKPFKGKNKCQNIVCYFTSWARYRPGNGAQFPKHVDGSLCTHIIYAFANIKGNKLVIFDNNDDSMMKELVGLRKSNPKLKVLVAVGGWNQASTGFSPMASSASNRKAFIKSTIKFLEDRDLDGLDLDWEYPTANKGGRPQDKKTFSSLMRELRAAFDKHPRKYILTAAVGAPPATAGKAYEIPVLSKQLDFINLMTYDFYGSWDLNNIQHHSALKASKPGTIDVESIIDYWVGKGASRDKLVLGIPMYGRGYKLATKTGKLRGSSANRPGKYTREAGFWSYYEVCDAMKKGGISKQGKSTDEGYFMIQGNTWIGYDSEEVVAAKTKYALQQGLAGVMVWDISLDDFSGQFCGKGRYPLLGKINESCRV